MKELFGVQILAYNQEEYIEYCLKSIYSYVDFIQIMYSVEPWIKYNSNARTQFADIDNTLEILARFPDIKNKIHITKGVWDDQESMRKEACNLLYERGAKFCLIIDADEIWDKNQFICLLEYVRKNLKENEVAFARYKQPFKWLNRLTDFPQARQAVCVKCNPSVSFEFLRTPHGIKNKVPEDIYFWHLGYVLPDNRMFEKVHTYGHSPELPENWYCEKWLDFSEKTTNFCRKEPTRWPRTVSIDPWELPSILHTHPFFPFGPSKNEELYEKVNIQYLMHKLNRNVNQTNCFNGFENIIQETCIKQKRGKEWVPNPERGLIIYWLIKAFSLSKYIEVGTSRGYSMLCAYQALSEINTTFKLLTIDANTEITKVAYNNFLKIHNKFPANIQIINSKSAKYFNDFNEIFEIIFIDGSHEKDDVLIDGIWALNHTSHFIIFDDYNLMEWSEVVSALDELMKNYSQGKWYLITSDRVLYPYQKKDILKISNEEYGMILFDKQGLLDSFNKSSITDIHSIL